MMMNPKSDDSATGGILALIAFVLVIVFFSGAMLLTLGETAQNRLNSAEDTPQPGRTVIAVLPTPTPNIVLTTYDQTVVNKGQSQFSAICAACHGMDGRGITGLGKNLVESEFISGLTDEELHAFIVVGRRPWEPLNTTGIDMPAKGGNPALSDESIDQIIAYVRTLRDPSLVVASSSSTTNTTTSSSDTGSSSNTDTLAALGALVGGGSAPSSEPTTDTLSVLGALVGGGSEPTAEPTSDSPTEEAVVTEEPAATEEAVATEESVATTEATPAPEVADNTYNAVAAYNGGCAGCHGVDGSGVPGVGTTLINGVMFGTDRDAIFTYLTTGVAPAGVGTGYPHPIRGGYLNLDDTQTNAIIDYVASLNPSAASEPTEVATEEPTAEPTEAPTEAPAVASTTYDSAKDYAINCAGCHGIDGKGIAGVGSNLADSTILSDDAALTDFLVNDVRAVVPTGAYPHPRVGMYAPLPEDQVQALVDYVQTLIGQ